MSQRCSVVSLRELEAEARRVWNELRGGQTIWLTGELGSGKTTFAQAIVRAAGAGPALSPTFSLVHEYRSAAGPIFHVDCYRLREFDEALDLDFPEMLKSGRAILVEWPEKAGPYAPAPDYSIRLAHTGDPTRRLLEVST